MKRLLIVGSLFLLLALSGGGAFAQEQVITPNPANSTAGTNEAVSIDVIYSTANPVDETLTGLGLRLHWDSSKLTFVDLTGVLSTNLLVQGTPEPDSANDDGDPATDTLVNVAWTDFGGNWPGAGTTPATLYTANFTTAANFSGSTTVNFSASSTAARRTLDATSATISAEGEEEAIVSIMATDPNAAEEGTDPGTFTVERMGGDTGSALTVNYSAGGSATAGNDYAALSGSVTIAAGSTTETITVTPVDDAQVENDETVNVTLTSGPNYTVGSPSSATVTIVDNDDEPIPPATVSITATDPNAAEAGTDPGTFTVERTGATGSALTVNYSVGGSATAGSDYDTLSGSVTISAGSATGTITVTPVNDTQDEGNETVNVTLTSGPNYTVGSPSSATVTIVDNDRVFVIPTLSEWAMLMLFILAALIGLGGLRRSRA